MHWEERKRKGYPAPRYDLAILFPEEVIVITEIQGSGFSMGDGGPPMVRFSELRNIAKAPFDNAKVLRYNDCEHGH
jgi:hypothetical protein